MVIFVELEAKRRASRYDTVRCAWRILAVSQRRHHASLHLVCNRYWSPNQRLACELLAPIASDTCDIAIMMRAALPLWAPAQVQTLAYLPYRRIHALTTPRGAWSSSSRHAPRQRAVTCTRSTSTTAGTLENGHIRLGPGEGILFINSKFRLEVLQLIPIGTRSSLPLPTKISFP